MNIFAKIQKWAALVGVRQSSAPDIATTESAVFFDSAGNPKLVIGASPDTVHHIPKTQNAGHEVTFTTTASTGVSSPLTLPTSGMLATEAVADSKDTAAISAHNLSSGIHGVSGTVVGTTDTQTLTNKKLSDTTTTIVDVVDGTKAIAFDAAGTTGTKTTITSSQTADRIITLPDAAGAVILDTATQTLTNKKLTGGAASTDREWVLPTKDGQAGLSSTQGNIMFDSTTGVKKVTFYDGTAWKPVGGGLTPLTITVSGSTPSIATLESGKHYVVDMSTATGDVSLTAPAAVAEVNFKVSVLKNFTSSWRVSINRAGSDNFYYNNQTDTAIRLYNPESWAEFFYLSAGLFGLNTDESGSSSGSSGQGRKNYILNPSAFSSATDNWTAANFTVSRDISTAIPRETTTGTAFKLVSTSTSATFLSDAMLLDDTDLSKKLGVEIAINVADSSNWTIDILASATAGGTYARLPLSTDVAAVTTLPATVGIFKTTVDMVAATPYIKFRITSAATAKTAYFSDILVTPDGNTVVGPVIEEWKSYTPSFTGFGSASTDGIAYQRIATSCRIFGRFLVGSSTAVEGQLSLPTGLTSASIPSASTAQICGKWWRNEAGASVRKTGTIITQGGRTYITFGSEEYTATTSPSAALNGSSVATSQLVYIDFTIPIAEWAGSGTVNLAQNDEEYAFNTSGITAPGATNDVAFGYGQQGAAIGSIDSGTGASSTTRMRCRFQSPIQSGDHISIEFSDGTNQWMDVSISDVQNSLFQGSSRYGVNFRIVNSTDVDVYFGNLGRIANNATYAGAGAAWSGIGTWKWRVRKTSGGKAIGFSHVVPGVSAGLVPAAGLPGRTDGVAVGAGYVGEFKQVFNTSSISSSSDTWTYINALMDITKGIWLIGYSVPITDPTGITGAFSRVVKVTQNADTGNVANSFIYAIDTVAGVRVLSKQFLYTATADLSSIELRFKTGGAGTMQAGPNTTGTITEEDCQPVFYAIRIA